VLSLCYWRTLLRYIAYNAVQARLCRHPFEYPYSSARFFLGGGAPPWFDRAAVERRLGHLDTRTMAQRYAALLRTPLSDGEVRLVELRMKHPRLAEDALDDLYRAPPACLAKWMARKIQAGRGESPWIPVAAPQAVLQAVTESEAQLGAYTVRASRKHHDGWSLLAAGLLHSLACLTTDASGKELGCHGATVSRRVRLHGAFMLEDSEYSRRAGVAARRALDLTFPG
jgi:hypothetical protein